MNNKTCLNMFLNGYFFMMLQMEILPFWFKKLRCLSISYVKSWLYNNFECYRCPKRTTQGNYVILAEGATSIPFGNFCPAKRQLPRVASAYFECGRQRHLHQADVRWSVIGGFCAWSNMRNCSALHPRRSGKISRRNLVEASSNWSVYIQMPTQGLNLN